MIRKNVDDHTFSKLKTHFTQAVRDLPRQRKREEKEREEELKIAARQKAEEEAKAEAVARKEADDADWKAFVTKRLEREQVEGAVLGSHKVEVGEEKREVEITLR